MTDVHLVRSAAGFNCDCFGCAQLQYILRRRPESAQDHSHHFFLLLLLSPVPSALQTDLGDREEASPPPHSSSRETPNSGQFVPQPASHLVAFPIDHHYHLCPSTSFAAPSSRKKEKKITESNAFWVAPSLELTAGSLDGFQWAWGCRHECRRRW